MTVTTLALGTCTAYLEPITGSGLLKLPPAEQDLCIGWSSLRAAEGTAAAHVLDRVHHFEITLDDDGWPCVEGEDADGCEVLGLYGREPISPAAAADVEECAQAFAELHRAAGLIPRQRGQ